MAQNMPGTLYKYRLRLPSDVSGDLVLLQWYYLTANSCKHAGYESYNFPPAWQEVYSALSYCNVNDADGGEGTPERFWNCAELQVTAAGPTNPPSPPTEAPVEQPSPTPPPTKEPTMVTTTTTPPMPQPSATTTTTTTSPPVSQPSATTTNPPTDYVVSTVNRCGVSELDARSNCGDECFAATDCEAGEWCWGVHANYCGSKTVQICNDLTQATGGYRCGINELEARELCGMPCTHPMDCTGDAESCWGVQVNTCDCNNGNRKLRGRHHY